MHSSSLMNMRKAKEMILGEIPDIPAVLDVGGRNNSAKERSYIDIWIPADYYVADIEDGPNVNCKMPTEYAIPAPRDMDVVVSGQTLEHVKNPFRLVTEMRRVLKRGGFMILIAPSGGYTHGEIDCWRFYRDAFKAIAEECRLEVIADWVDKDTKWCDHVFIGRKP